MPGVPLRGSARVCSCGSFAAPVVDYLMPTWAPFDVAQVAVTTAQLATERKSLRVVEGSAPGNLRMQRLRARVRARELGAAATAPAVEQTASGDVPAETDAAQ